ncbi:MAG: phage baseplate assembly protein V, partial [Myxococcota bacterium]
MMVGLVLIGTITGIVVDNKDPDKMHRIKVKFPSDSMGGMDSHSSWCRMISPMAGASRGLVMLPEIGTEVVVGFAYRSMSPYILGAVYNGKDLPEPYRNDDCLNNVRVFWSRGDHMVIFDDTDGAEKVSFGAQAPTRLNVESAGIHSILDSSRQTITERCDGDTIWEAKQTVSIKCSTFNLEASGTVEVEAGSNTIIKSGVSTTIEAGTTGEYKAGMVNLNASAPPPSPAPALPSPPHKHPPSKPDANLNQALGAANAVSGNVGAGGGATAGDAQEVEKSETEPRPGADGASSGGIDGLRESAKDTVSDAAVSVAGAVLGDRLTEEMEEKIEEAAEKAVDSAFDRAEDAARDFLGGGMSGGRGPSGGGGRPGG